MNILFEKDTPATIVTSVMDTLQKENIVFSCYQIEFHEKKIPLSSLSRHVKKNLGGKSIVIGKRKIEGQTMFGQKFDYYGITEAVGSDIGFVSLCERTEDRIGLIALHELIHISGGSHCSTPGCIMAYKLCQQELKYCLNCKQKCTNTHVCEKCRGVLYASN